MTDQHEPSASDRAIEKRAERFAFEALGVRHEPAEVVARMVMERYAASATPEDFALFVRCAMSGLLGTLDVLSQAVPSVDTLLDEMVAIAKTADL